jgi:replicative DNA helicase|tara:strand:- start:16 stop:1248 length:1233 start_codon:yes stop_codon:yes gene_type:complete
MMELALIRTLMDKDFYDNNKGIRCPDELFSKDVRKIKQTLDYAMHTYERTLTASELEALFFANNSTMTTATKQVYNDLFKRVGREEPMNKAIADEVLSKLFQQVLGNKLANIGFDYVNGSIDSLEPVRNLLQTYQDDFTPNLKLDFGDISIEHLLKANDIQSQWKWNIPSLARRVEGISGGHLVIVGARPNTGKTSFHASTIAAPNGFASQGAKCLILCNEEAYERVGARYLSAASSLSMEEVKGNYSLAASRYEPVREQIELYDSTGKDMSWVEAIIKAYKPDIVVLDMGDKFAVKSSDKSDVYLKNAAIHARNIAKQYNCAIIWMSQLSADAEGKINVDQSMLEGSKTGKAAEADLMVLISKNPVLEQTEDDSVDSQRYLILAKNKLKGGWHGKVTCELDGARAQYLA